MSIENGTAGNDTITAPSNADTTINGLAGSVLLTGLAGDDRI